MLLDYLLKRKLGVNFDLPQIKINVRYFPNHRRNRLERFRHRFQRNSGIQIPKLSKAEPIKAN